MKRLLTILLTVALLFASGPPGGPTLSVASTDSENYENYKAIPPFVSAGVPPLIMLVMGRNHKLYYEAYNDASDLDGDGTLDVGYNPDIDYYGYFDSHKCYVYSNANNRFEPSSNATDKKCSAANEWSGDFLNYLTMSRMDCLRKVLYGGYRSTDTETETVLERAYIPQDAHSWGKEYESIEKDGYDIREYTPLDLPAGPTGATRHLFVNTTLSEAGDPLLRVLEDSVYRIWDWVACEVPVAGDKVINGQTGPLVTDNSSVSGFDVTEGGSAGTITDVGFGNPSAEMPSKAFDDNTDTKWLTWGASTSGSWQDVWIQFQFDSPKRILKYTLTTGNDAEGRDPKAWMLQASNNGTVWTNVDTVSDGALPSGRKQKKEFTCDNPPSEDYIYYRLYITEKKNMSNTSDCGHHWCVQITEIEIMETVPATATLTDCHVRVKVCDPSMPESNSKMYPSGVYKPVGILQRHGESDRMYFGLITGSYSKNTSGGVLRKNISSITDEIDSNATGQFTSTDGIIKTIDALRVIGFDYGSHSYNQNCGWITTRPISQGECRMWGNPVGEMMYEGLRYFAGKGAATTDFNYSSGDDVTLGLPKPAWQDPYDPENGFFYCAKPFLLVLSDINPTYDSDQLPGSYFSSFTGDLTGLNVNSLANTICTEEGVAGSHFIGQSDSANYDGTCSEKDVTGFGGVRGLCPEEPTKQGSYYAASVAYFGRTEDLSDANSSQNVDTYAVGLASPLPRINIPVDNNIITLVPFAKSVGNYGISATEGNFQPTNSIVDFFVESINATTGTFRINFEDVEQGADHDMDAIVEYKYQVNDTSVDITLDSFYSAGSIIQHIGYIISGTTADGTYLEVRDYDTSSGSDPDYFLDTPPGQGPGEGWDDDTALPLTTTRTFIPGDSPAATLLENPLWYAAKWGGFEDKNDNDKPDLEEEWDNDGDGVPDTYFYVTNPLELEEKLNRSFAAMLNRVSSGSAASVISSSRSGEGAIYQSIFFPEIRGDLGETAHWVGNTHALFVDDYGNMHEDTDNDNALNVDEDYIIEFEGDTGKAKKYKYDEDSNTKIPLNEPNPEFEITEINFVWDALSRLSDPDMDVLTQRDPYDSYDQNDPKRYIFTDYIDTSADVSTANVVSTQVMDFTHDSDFVNDPDHDNYYFLNSYLTYDHDSDPDTAVIGLTEEQMILEAQNIIKFVRGQEGLSETGTNRPYPNRTLDKDGIKVYRLGDIIYSTPTVVSQPMEDYDLLYRDDSYREFRKKHLNRRTVVYSGANDGMLHAFNGGFYDTVAHKFKNKHIDETEFELGAELWAYVPNALLPHLKWLKETIDYDNHVYYVDLKPRVFDAKIFPDDNATHKGGWGTVLVGGMRLGGKPIGVDTTTDGNGDPAPDGTDDLSFRSTYFALDITNPEKEPSLLWSFSDDNLGFTTSYPTPIRVGSKWFIVIGSGPVDYEATRKDDGINFTEYGGSNRTASLYILNADDGTRARNSEFSMDAHSFMDAPIAVDFDLATTLDGNDTLWTGEAIYVASDGCGAGLEGQVFRIKTNEDENPNNWTKAVFFNPNTTSSDHQHINTALSVAKDDEGRIWVYFGTGRFWSTLDRQSDPVNYLGYQNTFYGIKEPVDANGTLTYAGEPGVPPVPAVGAKASHLRNVTGIEVEDYYNLSLNTSTPHHGAAVIDRDGDGNVTFSDLEAEVQAKDGWYLNFSETGERNLGQAAVLGGIVTFSTFVPNNDLCAYEGRSYLYGLYYKTGTAYWEGVLKTDDNNGTGIDPNNKVVSKIDLGKGYSETPNIHTGREAGSKAFVQMSTGAIIGIEQANPGITKSGKASWQEYLN